MNPLDLYWLPECSGWATRLAALPGDDETAWNELVALANARIDFLQTERLAAALRRRFPAPPSGLATRSIRLAVLGSGTLSQLIAGLRVAALRRSIWLDTYEADYGQYLQELTTPQSRLHLFQPNAVLFAFDAAQSTAPFGAALRDDDMSAAMEEAIGHIVACWSLAREAFACPILQQTILPIFPPVLGNNEHRLLGSRSDAVQRLNRELAVRADLAGVDLVAIDQVAAWTGLQSWFDPTLWHRAKQEISPYAAPLYGDMVGRLLAAKQGRSAKCLVLDLDNTLWGGVVGDDGLEGIVLGQGSADGEAFVDLQRYALDLAKRGVLIAVCSKNDEAVAREVFERHPEMQLRAADIACFIANWDDKPTNLRRIAHALNIGLDALVFVDDNPFERNIVRAELPMVAVPEIPEEPALVARCIADAGYFEAVVVTDDDRARTDQYQANRKRADLQSAATDMPAYLRSLEMKLNWRQVDDMSIRRVVQLINKTNQFNLTTRRYNEDEIRAIMKDHTSFIDQFRLTDRFGDNGLISVVIGRAADEQSIEIDTWLMSCRVLGRGVEQAILNVVAKQADMMGRTRILGRYKPTKKNGMVAEHYDRLGFSRISTGECGETLSGLDLTNFSPLVSMIDVVEDEG